MTPTQQTIYDYLHAGMAYTAADLALLANCEESAVAKHISCIRRHLESTALDIVCRGGAYRLIRVQAVTS